MFFVMTVARSWYVTDQSIKSWLWNIIIFLPCITNNSYLYMVIWCPFSIDLPSEIFFCFLFVSNIVILGLIETLYLSILFIILWNALALSCIWNVWSPIWERKTAHKSRVVQLQVQESRACVLRKYQNSRNVHFYKIIICYFYSFLFIFPLAKEILS